MMRVGMIVCVPARTLMTMTATVVHDAVPDMQGAIQPKVAKKKGGRACMRGRGKGGKRGRGSRGWGGGSGKIG